MNTPILSCKNISKSFGATKAVAELSFDLYQGDILSILGPSGCGKTTLLRIIAGLEEPTAGNITLLNNTIYNDNINIPPNKRNVGMIFQDYALFSHLNVKDNISFGISQLKSKDQKEIVNNCLEITRLKGQETKYPHQLSGGQQQRVALARTLATSPSLILMDEPFSNLDTQLRLELRNQVYEILRETNTTTIFVTHDRDEAFVLSDKIGVMLDGEILQIDSPDKVYFWPNNKDVGLITGNCSFIKGRIQNETAITSIGNLPLREKYKSNENDEIEVLVRPNDLLMTVAKDGNCEVIKKEFRGDETLFWVKIPSGEIIPCKHKKYTTLFEGLKVTLNADQHVKFNAFK